MSFKVTKKEIIDLKADIYSKHKSVRSFCEKNKLNYAYIVFLFNNPAKISLKYWVLITNAVEGS